MLGSIFDELFLVIIFFCVCVKQSATINNNTLQHYYDVQCIACEMCHMNTNMDTEHDLKRLEDVQTYWANMVIPLTVQSSCSHLPQVHYHHFIWLCLQFTDSALLWAMCCQFWCLFITPCPFYFFSAAFYAFCFLHLFFRFNSFISFPFLISISLLLYLSSVSFPPSCFFFYFSSALLLTQHWLKAWHMAKICI